MVWNLSKKVKIILLAIPVTGWINSSLYRFSKDNFCAGLFALIFGPIFWFMDLVFFLVKGTLGLWSENVSIKNNSLINEAIDKGEGN